MRDGMLQNMNIKYVLELVSACAGLGFAASYIIQSSIIYSFGFDPQSILSFEDVILGGINLLLTTGKLSLYIIFIIYVFIAVYRNIFRIPVVKNQNLDKFFFFLSAFAGIAFLVFLLSIIIEPGEKSNIEKFALFIRADMTRLLGAPWQLAFIFFLSLPFFVYQIVYSILQIAYFMEKSGISEFKRSFSFGSLLMLRRFIAPRRSIAMHFLIVITSISLAVLGYFEKSPRAILVPHPVQNEYMIENCSPVKFVDSSKDVNVVNLNLITHLLWSGSNAIIIDCHEERAMVIRNLENFYYVNLDINYSPWVGSNTIKYNDGDLKAAIVKRKPLQD